MRYLRQLLELPVAQNVCQLQILGLLNETPVPLVLTMPTCNRFNSEFVRRQWKDVKRLYGGKIEPVLGTLIGNSLDNDSRRRKLMLHVLRDVLRSGLRPQQQQNY